MNNFYLYRPQDQNLFSLIPWDKSETFRDGPAYPIFHNIYDVPGADQKPPGDQGPRLRRSQEPLFRHAARMRAGHVGGRGRRLRLMRADGWSARSIASTSRSADAALADTEKPYTNEQFTAGRRGDEGVRARAPGVRQQRGRQGTAAAAS